MKKYIRAVIAGIICLACIFSAASCKDKENPTDFSPPLHFNENGEFVIVQFADFHEWASIDGIKSEKDILDHLSPLVESYIRSVLDTVKPNFVILTGDNIFNLSWMDVFLKISAHTITLMADIFEEKQVYWTYTFGNHDTEGGTTKDDYLKATSSYKYFIGGVEDGEYYNALSYNASKDDYRAGNYSIPI